MKVMGEKVKANEVEFVGKCLLIKSNGKKILAVGDLHLGYEEFLNEAGVFVSREMFKEMIRYFENVFLKVGKVEKVILLGDVKHGFGNILRQEWNDVLNLFDYLQEKCKEIIIIKGNHDKIIEPIAKKREIKVLNYYCLSGFCFLHGDTDFPKSEIYSGKIKCWVLGHGHPAIKLSDGVKVEKYKCFLEGNYRRKKIIIVPSFIEANEGSDPRDSELGMAWDFNLENFEVKIISSDANDLRVRDFGRLGRI